MEKKSATRKFFCAKCQDEYVLELNSNTCLKTHWSAFYVFGYFIDDDLILNAKLRNILYIDQLKVCLEFQCITKGYYFDFLTRVCKNVQQNKLMDHWKIEIYLRNLCIKQKLQDEIQFNSQVDYEIQIRIMNINNTKLMEGKKCVEFKLVNYKFIRSVDQNGQCLKCQQNLNYFYKIQKEYFLNINKLFLFQEENYINTRSYFKPMP